AARLAWTSLIAVSGPDGRRSPGRIAWSPSRCPADGDGTDARQCRRALTDICPRPSAAGPAGPEPRPDRPNDAVRRERTRRPHVVSAAHNLCATFGPARMDSAGRPRRRRKPSALPKLPAVQKDKLAYNKQAILLRSTAI